MGTAQPEGPGAQRHPPTFPTRQPWFSGARKCRPPCSPRFLPAAPQIPNTPTSAHQGRPALHLCAVRLQARRCSGRPRVFQPAETSVTAAACPHSGRAGRTATGRLSSRVRGAGGDETPSGAAAPDGLKLTRRTPRSRTGWSCWTLSPCAPRDASRSAPEPDAARPLPWPGRSQPPRPPAHGKVPGTRRKHQPPDSACTSCSAR